MDKIKKCIKDIFLIQDKLNSLKSEYRWRGLGNLIGDYGECWAIHELGFKKANNGRKNYDAYIHLNESDSNEGEILKIQIKTILHSKSIGIRGKSDYLVVVKVDAQTACASVLYQGPCPTPEQLSKHNLSWALSKRDNKISISLSNLLKYKEKLEELDSHSLSLESAIENLRNSARNTAGENAIITEI